MHYYQRHIGDYAKDTGHLSLMEHGVYAVLLDWAYGTERGLPDDDTAIFRICRATTAAEKRAVRNIVAEFFPKTDQGRHCKRVVEEITKFNQKVASCRVGGAKTAVKRWGSSSNPPATGNHEPLTNTQQPRIGGGESVSDSAVIEFGKNFKGEAASGMPVMPEQWIYQFLKKINGRREWPDDWRAFMVSSWRAEFKGWSADGSKKNAAGETKKMRETWQVEKELAAVRERIRLHPRMNWPGNKLMEDAVMKDFENLVSQREELMAELNEQAK